MDADVVQLLVLGAMIALFGGIFASMGRNNKLIDAWIHATHATAHAWQMLFHNRIISKTNQNEAAATQSIKVGLASSAARQ